MRIKNIDLTNFRNFRSASFRFEDGLNFIVGPNGVGKTNLLEAIAYLSVPKSFRNIRDNELVLWDESWFRIEGEVESEVGTAHRIAVVYSKNGKKRISLDNKTLRSFKELFRTFSTLIVDGKLHEVIDGSPDVRRRFIDRFISLIDFEYFTNILEYRRIIEQRNAALKADGAAYDRISPWNTLMTQIGNSIISARAYWCERLSNALRDLGLEILGKSVGFRYEPSIDHLDEDVLTANLKKELELGYTLVGPHRDDFVVLIDSKSARSTASEGEKRMALIALVIAMRRLHAEHTGRTPVLLMDEPTNVLTPEKMRQILGLLDGQVIIAMLRSHLPDSFDANVLDLTRRDTAADANP